MFIKKKFLKVVLQLNGHIGSLRILKNEYSHNYYLYYRSNRVILNIFFIYKNFNVFVSLFKSLILSRCKIFFISNNSNFSKFIFYYTKRLNQYCFVGNWVPGFLTNLDQLFKKLFLRNNHKFNDNRKKKKFKRVKFNYLNNPKFLNKVDLIFLLGSTKSFLDFKIFKEGLKYHLPIIGFLDTSFKLEYIPYFVLVNIKRRGIVFFLFYLLMVIYIKIKNFYYKGLNLKGRLSNNNTLFYKRYSLNLFKYRKNKKLW